MDPLSQLNLAGEGGDRTVGFDAQTRIETLAQLQAPGERRVET